MECHWQFHLLLALGRWHCSMVSNTNSSCRIALHKKAAALETRTGFPGCQASQALFVALGKPNLSSWTNSFHEISTVPTTVALHCPATLKTLEKTSEKKIEGTQNTFPKRSYSYTFARIHPCQHPWKASIFPLIHPCNSQAPSASGVAGTGGVGGFGRASKALTVSNTSFRSFFYRNARQHRDVFSAWSDSKSSSSRAWLKVGATSLFLAYNI